MSTCAVDVLYHACGRQHRVTSGLMLHGRPTQAGTLAELYRHGDFELRAR